MVDGGVAEWLMALVLKTSKLTLRRFESCPLRQSIKIKSCQGLYFYVPGGEQDENRRFDRTTKRVIKLEFIQVFPSEEERKDFSKKNPNPVPSATKNE